jgi:hypothetical protein
MLMTSHQSWYYSDLEGRTMKMMALCMLLSTAFAVSQTPDVTPVDARISGTVVDTEGKAIPRAIVYAREEASSLADAYRVQTTTDAAGRFDFGPRLKHAVYELYARKDKDGYPDPSAAFYRALDFTPVTVQLFGARPEAVVALKLGDKAGVLTARIIDGDTGQPLSAGVVLINVQADARRDELANGRFRELLPANTDVDVLVERVGADHDGWLRFETELNLQPGEQKDLEIRLYRRPAP